MCGVVPEALARRKLVKGDFGSEGSETANSGNDEQQRGYESLFTYYQKIAPFLYEPFYMWTQRKQSGELFSGREGA